MEEIYLLLWLKKIQPLQLVRFWNQYMVDTSEIYVMNNYISSIIDEIILSSRCLVSKICQAKHWKHSETTA